MSKKVIIKTKQNYTKLPDEVYYNSKKSVGACLTASGEIETGLTIDEEDKFLPSIIRVSKNDPNFQDKVRDFYANLSVEVIPGGTDLEIGTDEKGNFLNPIDYLKYRFIYKHPKVAHTQEDGERSRVFNYYLFDPKKAEKEKYEYLQNNKKAYAEYIKVSKDIEKTRLVLLTFGENPDKLTSEQKDIKLEELAKSSPTEFYDICKDKHLETKSFILECISKSVLQKVGNAIYDGDDKLGDKIEDAVKYLEDKANSEIYVKLQSRLKAMG